MFDTSLNHFKSVFAHKHFVEPADENYFLARFCRAHGFHEQFYWNSAQAIEKLLKAGLILNGVPSKGYSHRLRELFDKHCAIFGNLAIREFAIPPGLSHDLWRGISPSTYISEIEVLGRPSVRYGEVSWAIRKDDLFLLDQIVFELRRRTIGLDWVIGLDWDEKTNKQFNGLTYREFLELAPKRTVRRINLPSGPITRAGTELSDVFHAWNFSFTRDQSDLKRPAPSSVAPIWPAIKNTYLALIIEEHEAPERPLSPSESYKLRWLVDYIQLDRDVSKWLSDKLR